MKITAKDRLLSLHFLPLECGMLIAVLVFCMAPNYAVWSLMFFISGLLCTFAMLNILPLAPLKSGGTHHVGIRHITREIAVYYPTFIKPIEGEPWLPGNDSHYIQTMAAGARVRSLWLSHLKLVRIPCTRNASIVSLMTHDGGPRKVFIFSHTLATHHLAYSRLALALAASGALVYSVLHADGIDVSFERSSLGSSVGEEEEEFPCERGLTQEGMLMQLEKRIEDVVGVMEGIFRGEMLRQLQVGPVELQSFLSSGAKVNLIGHGFGALTMLAVAVKATAILSFINSIVAFDAWPLSLLDRTVGDPISMPSHIKVQLFDSEEWSERRVYAVRVEELKGRFASSGVSCLRTTCSGTDHMSVMDMGLLLPLTKRRRFVSKKSSKLIPMLATEVLRCTEGS
ncbi:phospholipase A2-like protein [Trypanosoma cruzi Dm28c]|uniref:1-alkyl-2-acetylglycerophosphocholine esterase n=1 Tax=Trypanosoma cruzi Dm28c TaxID=1416333 RepID=V5BTH3_TRYCR|nr:phospholipase A2-like protein [Trypanosoma cruzi Dm28c]